MSLIKTKTQVTLNSDLNLIVSSLQSEYPIFNINKCIELLIAKGTKAYLEEHGLSIEDLRDLNISRNEVETGQTTKTKNMSEAIKKLKE